MKHTLLNNAQKTAPENTSTSAAVYNQNVFSVAYASQNLPLNSIVQKLLIKRRVYYLVVAYYFYKFVCVPIMIFTLTCWPCLTCGCIVCTSVFHCCCCSWLYKRILVLLLLIAIFYPIGLLVQYFDILFYFLLFISLFLTLRTCIWST